MTRYAFPAAVCLVLAQAFFASAESSDQTWKDLVVKGTYAKDANDLAKAESIFLQALHEAEHFGADDARVATTLNDLGEVYRQEKKFTDAEGAYKRAYTIVTLISGEDSTDAAEVDFNIAGLMFEEEHPSTAIPYLRKALATYQSSTVVQNTTIARVLCMLGDAYRLEKDFRAAEEPLHQCADIREREGGMQNAELAEALHSLALTYEGEGKLTLAEPRFTLAEKICESTLGITSPVLAQTMEDHAILLRQMNRAKEAARLDLLVAAIRRNRKTAGK
jgi:tetratricopeptide (TPR) repeat protein